MNMSYCRWQNTEIALRDCLNSLYDYPEAKLSKEETAARTRMVMLAQSLLHVARGGWLMAAEEPERFDEMP